MNGAIRLLKNYNSSRYFFQKRTIIGIIIILLFAGFSISKFTVHSFSDNNLEEITYETTAVPMANVTIPIDVVFSGYNDEYLDINMINNSLDTAIIYYGIDNYWDEDSQQYISLLDLEITLDYNFYITTPSFDSSLDSFIDTNSWNANTSALNATQLNLQESTGARLSIFYDQEGKAIDGEAVEEYLSTNKGFSSDYPSYIIYFLNQSRFDTSDHSFEHWFEIDEEDPDSNITADFWRLEWDNDLNPDVEFPYPCWGFQNRLFFVDPYCHQWYTIWTDIWWNSDPYEGDFDYLTVDLDTYLEGYTPGTIDFTNHLNTYLSDYLNDIATDVGGRGDGLLYDQKEISAQTLFINDEANHGYSQEDLDWIYHNETINDVFDYVVPNEVANITLDDTWVELVDEIDLQMILVTNTLGAAELGTYPWYNPSWTYLDGMAIFDEFEKIADNYFNMSKGDSIFTSWILLLKDVSMVAWAYGEFREFTGLGGGGNVVCFKDLNRYYASDGTTPRSGVTALLTHEIGHVLGFRHAEINNDAEQGTGGFMRDVMSYYCEGAVDFSIFLKDSLYRTSSFIAYYKNKPAIDAYRINNLHNETILGIIDQVISDGELAIGTMNYVDAYLYYRQLYELTKYLPLVTPTSSTPLGYLLPLILIIPIAIFINKKRNHK
ncbi:MAG: hypothetical protein FK733_17725 [Asgard group archaeon]|nr:hypothetical protein [Asgard group archaeon]